MCGERQLFIISISLYIREEAGECRAEDGEEEEEEEDVVRYATTKINVNERNMQVSVRSLVGPCI